MVCRFVHLLLSYSVIVNIYQQKKTKNCYDYKEYIEKAP